MAVMKNKNIGAHISVKSMIKQESQLAYGTPDNMTFILNDSIICSEFCIIRNSRFHYS